MTDDEPTSCIYCRRPSHDARAVEHVIPESLGNSEWVLPRGAVCDDCNHRLGGTIEAGFVNRDLGALRHIAGVPGKRGYSTWTPPIGALAVTLPGGAPLGAGGRIKSLLVTPADADPVDIAREAEHTLRFDMTIRLPIDKRERSRFVSRILLASVCSLLGRRAALTPGLDIHRSNLRPAGGHLPVLAVPVQGEPHPTQAWAVLLARDGICLELWSIAKLSMRFDGHAVDSETESTIVLDTPGRQPLLVTGRPGEPPEARLGLPPVQPVRESDRR